MHISFQKFNPNRAIGWRNDRVVELLAREPKPGRVTSRDDNYVRDWRSFSIRYRRGSEDTHDALFRENPGMFYANLIHNNADPFKKAVIQSMLLAGQNDMEISKVVGTIPQSIQYYEALFFNVRDRLEAKHWIVGTVLTPSYLRHSDSNEDYMMFKLFGYFGGPILLDFMLTGFKPGIGLPASPEDMDLYLDKHFFNGIRRRSAIHVGNFEVNKYNVMELFATHCRLVEIEKSVESQDEARSGMEKNILSMLHELPWAVGRTPSEGNDAGARLLKYEQAAGELTEEEMMQVAAGVEDDSMVEVLDIKLPPPRKTKKDDNDTEQGS